MSEITITDQTDTDRQVTVDCDEAVDAIRDWFFDAPAEIEDALSELQDQLDRGGYTGDSEAYLAIRID